MRRPFFRLWQAGRLQHQRHGRAELDTSNSTEVAPLGLSYADAFPRRDSPTASTRGGSQRLLREAPGPICGTTCPGRSTATTDSQDHIDWRSRTGKRCTHRPQTTTAIAPATGEHPATLASAWVRRNGTGLGHNSHAKQPGWRSRAAGNPSKFLARNTDHSTEGRIRQATSDQAPAGACNEPDYK